MKKFTRLPLYLGLIVFVTAVLLSAIKVGEKNNLTSTKSRAGEAGAVLTMKFIAPDMVNVSFSSDKPVTGVDTVIEYEKNKISILPSTLTPGPSFITTGGVINEDTSTFSFSALSKDSNIKAGIIGTFKVVSQNKNAGVDTNLNFRLGEGGSSVTEEGSGSNILSKTEGVKFTLSLSKG